MKLTLEQSAYFDAMDELFATDGWRKFMDDVQGWKEALRDGWQSYRTDRDTAFAQGRAQMCDQILTFEDFCDELKKGILDAPEPEVELHASDV